MMNFLLLVVAFVSYANAAALGPTPTTLVRCKSVVTDANYKAERMDCPSNQFCSSEYWQYTLALNPGQDGCYIGPEDFGQFRFDFNTSDCTGLN